MTKITIDRSTVEQALEALKGLRLGMPDSVLARSVDHRINVLRAALADPQEPCNKSCAPGYCYCEPVQEPVAWATVCDGVIDSCSLTKIAAKLKAENLRDRNRGRNFVFGVRPLSYSTQQQAEPVQKSEPQKEPNT